MPKTKIIRQIVKVCRDLSVLDLYRVLDFARALLIRQENC